jgi:hypothetical protein
MDFLAQAGCWELTRPMEQSFWQARSFSDFLENPQILPNLKGHYGVHKSPATSKNKEIPK